MKGDGVAMQNDEQDSFSGIVVHFDTSNKLSITYFPHFPHRPSPALKLFGFVQE